MDSQKEGYLLIGTTMIVLLVFVVALLLLMLVYRRRRIEHAKEMKVMKDKYDREILENQLAIQQETMQQIGREIHDNVGQKLTLAALYTTHLSISNKSHKVDDSPEKIDNIGQLINESLENLRVLSRDLTATDFASMQLDVLLDREITKLNRAEICKAHFAQTGTPVSLQPEITNMILRIVQEFLQNSIKHSGCRNIYLQLQYEDTGCHLLMKDDGKGFSQTETVLRNGIGINNMKKRASLGGAQFVLKSTPGKGTELELMAPVQKMG